MATQTTTRDRIMDASYGLFYRNGCHAVGLDVILKEADVSKGTFYNHFESKDQLFLEIVEKRDARWRKNFRAEIEHRGGDDPVSQLRSIFDVLHEWFVDAAFQGCIFINTASEFPSPLDPAHKAAKANIDAIREIIAEIADNAGIAEPTEFARQLNLVIEGAIVTEVIDRNHESAQVGVAVANALINMHLAEAEAYVSP